MNDYRTHLQSLLTTLKEMDQSFHTNWHAVYIQLPNDGNGKKSVRLDQLYQTVKAARDPLPDLSDQWAVRVEMPDYILEALWVPAFRHFILRVHYDKYDAYVLRILL